MSKIVFHYFHLIIVDLVKWFLPNFVYYIMLNFQNQP